MIGALTSLLPATNGILPGLATPATIGSSGFGPDFLVSALGSRASTAGSVYDSNGRLVTPGENSPDVKARKDALEQAKKLLKSGDYAGAREAANSILAKNPADAIAAAYVGKAYLAEGNYSEAEKYLARAASGASSDQIDTDLHAAQILGKGEGAAVEEIKRLLSQPSTARKGAQIASYLLDQNPGNADARVALVNFYEGLGQVNLAGAELADAVETTPKDKLDQIVKRVEAFNKAHTEDAASFDLLAQAYVRTGRLSEAQQAFEQATNLAAGNLEFQVQIKEDFSKTYFTLARDAAASGKDDEARRLYLQGLDIFSTDTGKGEFSDLELARGIRETRSGRLKLALDGLENARSYLPGTATDKKKDELIAAYEALANKFDDTGDLKSVVASRYGAFIVDPADDTRKRALADAYDSYGQDLMSKGDYRGAFKQFKAAMGYYNTDANYAAHYADAQSRF